MPGALARAILEASSLAGSEVRRVFGRRTRQVEDVLVCFVFGQAVDCTDIQSPANEGRQESELAEARRRLQKLTPTYEQLDQKTNQLFNMLSTVLKNSREVERAIVRNIL